MKVVILCGGKGTRLGKIDKPKALVEIGGKPIIWHIMKIYKQFGYNDFIFCLGHLGNKIKEYFKDNKEFNITFVDTGLETKTGGRLKRIEKYITGDRFFATYGDGVADINIKDLLNFHLKNKKIGTITLVRQHSPFGRVLTENGLIVKFEEKPLLDDWINGGFFVFEKKVFNFIGDNDILERKPFEKLVSIKELCGYKHHGFWKCMDTFKDKNILDGLWKTKAPWKIWRD